MTTMRWGTVAVITGVLVTIGGDSADLRQHEHAGEWLCGLPERR